jgi:hypothetical protein
MSLRILLVLALLLNAAAGTAAADDPGGGHASDCCSQAACDCGCAAPQAMTAPVSLSRTSWRTALPRFTVVVKSFNSSPLPAPFRPPA